MVVVRWLVEVLNVDTMGVILAQHFVLFGEEWLTLQVGAADLEQKHIVNVLRAHAPPFGALGAREVVLQRRRSRCRAT